MKALRASTCSTVLSANPPSHAQSGNFHEPDPARKIRTPRHRAQPAPANAPVEPARVRIVITERSGYVLQGADVNLFLAELAMEGVMEKVESGKWNPSTSSGQRVAREYAQKALKLAHCDDGPPYHYKVAYEEAERLLAKLEKQEL